MSGSSSSNSIISRAVVITNPGKYEDVLEVYDIDLKQAKDDQIVIEMLFASVNPSDALRIQGIYPTNSGKTDLTVLADSEIKTVNGNIVGFEGVGRVIEKGKLATNAINDTVDLGDWVIPLDFSSYGSWSTKLVLNPSSVIVVKNKAGLTPEAICSTKVNALTAYRMLLDIVKLEKGDYVIQNGANSGAGQYLIQFARIFGYKTINVIRDRSNYDETVSFLKDLGADIVLKDTDLTKKETFEYLSLLDGKIKLAINCIGGKASEALATHLIAGGTMATYGAITMDAVSLPAPLFIFKDIRLQGYWLNSFFEKSTPKQLMKTWDHIFDLLRTGQVKAQVTKYIDMFESENGKDVTIGIDQFKSKVMDSVNSSVKVGFRFSNY
ncbi:Trans-2-enoyl-CoA reductase, mitochondrial [Smittium culicis]|uniref:enoyl-[acyl-carrier-protein] reductase n=1 Tax=Smittium culicis TaxID=133412 RepID=A0A1R1YNI2_9FUNG|nr:Trans-2-enoyl-CoA reductase, mitochondrial [Smittium culicis]